jgi:hypothetical protein
MEGVCNVRQPHTGTGAFAGALCESLLILVPYLSGPQLIAVGYALEQALNGRVGLDATICTIGCATLA